MSELSLKNKLWVLHAPDHSTKAVFWKLITTMYSSATMPGIWYFKFEELDIQVILVHTGTYCYRHPNTHKHALFKSSTITISMLCCTQLCFCLHCQRIQRFQPEVLHPNVAWENPAGEWKPRSVLTGSRTSTVHTGMCWYIYCHISSWTGLCCDRLSFPMKFLLLYALVRTFSTFKLNFVTQRWLEIRHYTLSRTVMQGTM